MRKTQDTHGTSILFGSQLPTLSSIHVDTTWSSSREFIWEKPLIQKTQHKASGFSQIHSATPGEMHRDFCTPSFGKLSLGKQQCWVKTPWINTEGADPGSRKPENSTGLRWDREQTGPRVSPGQVALEKTTALQTPSKVLFKIPCFLSNTFRAEAFHKHDTSSMTAKSPGDLRHLPVQYTYTALKNRLCQA